MSIRGKVISTTYFLLRFCKRLILLRLRSDAYEIRIAPLLAMRLSWIFWPLYRLLKACRICFVVNTVDGTGQIIIDLDYFLRRLRAGHIAKGRRYVWIRPFNYHALFCIRLYRKHFWWVAANTGIYYLTLPITMKYRDIIVDSGTSRSRWQIPLASDDIFCVNPKTRNRELFIISRKSHLEVFSSFYRAREATPGYFPLREARFKEDKRLDSFLGRRREKLALIHLRQHILNASAAPTDPRACLDTLGYLRDSGFSLVYVGREKMPEVFKKFDMLNYANSELANFYRDIYLFSLAKVALICASGLQALADMMALPYLYINSWHLSLLLPSCSINVPALVRYREGNFILFRQQMELFWSGCGEAPLDIFPSVRYEAVNADSEAILLAMQELLEKPERSEEVQELQHRFWQCCDDFTGCHAKISTHLLLKYRHLIDARGQLAYSANGKGD